MIADRNVLDRGVLDGAPRPTVRHPRCPVGQRLQVALGARNRIVLQHGAAGIHDGDDGARQTLPKRQRGHHGDECDGVDAHAPGQEVACYRDQQGDDHGQCAGGPQPLRSRAPAGRRGDCAKHQPCERGDDQATPNKSLCAFRQQRCRSGPMKAIPTARAIFFRKRYVNSRQET